LFQDSPSLAMGLFEGHMAKMAEGFKAVRKAELELAGKYHKDVHDKFFTYFGWRQFSDDEYRLCPPVVSVGGDGAMYDIGFQNLSRCLMSGMPVKILVLDTQVYSNTGGQACTSGFIGQVADMSPYGTAKKGKEEMRKEMGLIAMAHRTAFVLQGAISNVNHLLEGYIDGLNYRGPAIWNVYAACQPEHGIGDDASEMQSKLAVESRAYPLTVYNPELGTTWKECTSLKGNPDIDRDWTTYMLTYKDEYGIDNNMQLPLTFADWALTEGRFRKHFKIVPPDKWNGDMLELVKFIDLDASGREGKFPYIWAIDPKDNTLMRVAVSREIVKSSIERRDFWRLLKGLTGAGDIKIDTQAIAAQAKAEMAQSLAASLLKLAGGDFGAPGVAVSPPAAGGTAAPAAAPAAKTDAPAASGYEPVWIETPECTACDECTSIAPGIFKYNEEKKAAVFNPTGGSYEDIVKAAEKCSARIIHPGTPWNFNEANLEKLLKRAEKFQ
jgi:pyruvate-ferredoxin/flavodoxin oxidoreductase